MRGAAWMVFLLLIPLASGLHTPLHPVDELNSVGGQERLLVLEDGVWTSEHWSKLLVDGVQPLRSVRPDALLVWDEGGVFDQQGGVQEEPFSDAVFTGTSASGVSSARVLFEPRLPMKVIVERIDAISALGVDVLDQRLNGFGTSPNAITVHQPSGVPIDALLAMEGILWVEPVLTTQARNGISASLMEHDQTTNHPFWELGLNASGIIIGVADSGLDADHACFRNATDASSAFAEASADYPAVGLFGDQHRKIVLLNSSIDGNDTPGHSDYRHGTHVIGTLACHDIDSYRSGSAPSNGSSLAHGARLVVQDIVSEEGWAPPEVDRLLWEASTHGAVIHSNSWGDDTTAYTERTGRFDAYAKEMPWSLALIAPGNSGEGVLEPANGRNVMAVGASTKAVDPARWGSSSYGPTELGTHGIFMLAPGSSVQSAAGDGFWDTNNGNLRSSSGTSMATPAAAGATGVVQQLYEEGWLVEAFEPLENRSLNELRPVWVGSADSNSALLGEGFTPSGPLLRATMALATTPLSEAHRNDGRGGYELQNPYEGWGVVNLSALLDPSTLADGTSPSEHLWIHDSYRLVDGAVDSWVEERSQGQGNLSNFADTPWYGDGATGPFLSTGASFQQRLTPQENSSIRIRMAFPAQPEPAMVDDLQLRVRLEDGTVLLPDRIQADGTPTKFYGSVVDLNNTTTFTPSNETVVGIDIPASYLTNASYIDVEIAARYVQPGGVSGALGLDGDAVGFGLVVQGVERDSTDHLDGDGDGIPNVDDACPFENAAQADNDNDGCLDDQDGDGVVDPNDACPTEDATGFDADKNGCLDDSDGDGITDEKDVCSTPDLQWPVTSDGCYPNDALPSVIVEVAPLSNTSLDGQIVVQFTINDDDGDPVSAELNVVEWNRSNVSVASCQQQGDVPLTFGCEWNFPDDFQPYYQEGGQYELRLKFQTSNQSPGADMRVIEVVLSEGLTIPFSQSNQPNATAPSGGGGTVALALLGFLGGLMAARWLASTRKHGPVDANPPPFAPERPSGKESRSP